MRKTFLALAVLAVIAQSGSAFANPYPGGSIWEDTIVPLDASKPKITNKVG